MHAARGGRPKVDRPISDLLWWGGRPVWVHPGDFRTVGAALAAGRCKGNLTQADLVRRLGKPQSVVSAYEAGTRRLDVAEFVLIARTVEADPLRVFREIVRSLPE
jgi:hypothetical protein